ncbi:hypothetical protein NIIDNTM18_42060 [Mycolicibacterium litorale]|uniref:HNH endonuclease n=1 Tax=Mycolicibacterium litorale TaxID=758802 RepID=A0A6S6PG10_9MYCO|nr:NUMOD4 motif-containing HNH endonuclease [Mycolicibacterium litorale]BCI54928.1 hypothetical protein NIIDNTM18_42060 [Mycolicibacterium litorale]
MEPIEEQWRPVVGCENAYEVSDQGRVRSLDRIGTQINGKTGTQYMSRRRGKILRPATANSGHRYVVLQGRTTRTVHSLVADAFLGPRPAGAEVRHKNGRPDDCRASNLEYGTRSENAEDSKRHGTHFHAGLLECKRGHDLTDPRNLQKSKTNKRVCLACRRDRAQLYKAGQQVKAEGCCINGHPAIPENRYTNGVGKSRCKVCVREKKQQKKAA